MSEKHYTILVKYCQSKDTFGCLIFMVRFTTMQSKMSLPYLFYIERRWIIGMLSKPKFMIPSTNISECTIDVNADEIPFSCIVDGNEEITDWQIKLYNLSDGSEALDTGKQPLLPHFFPVDEKNQNVVFKKDLKPYLKSTFKNDRSEYYWTIQFWGISGTSVTSHEEVFYANSAPEIDITCSKEKNFQNPITLSDDAVLNAREYYFKATYTQAESISLKRYGWRLIDTDSGQVLFDTITHNQIYGTAGNIICSYEGFLDGGSYSIELYVETQNNMAFITAPVNFYVSYNTMVLSKDFKVENLRTEPAVVLDWTKSIFINGRYVENGSGEELSYRNSYPVSGGNISSVVLPDDSYIVFERGTSSDINISEDVSIVLSTQISDEKERTLFSMEGDEGGTQIARNLSYANGSFLYTVTNSDGNSTSVTYTPGYAPSRYTWYIIIMAPFSGVTNDILTVIESRATNGLYPSSKLYPGQRAPSFGTWDKLKAGV